MTQGSFEEKVGWGSREWVGISVTLLPDVVLLLLFAYFFSNPPYKGGSETNKMDTEQPRQRADDAKNPMAKHIVVYGLPNVIPDKHESFAALLKKLVEPQLKGERVKVRLVPNSEGLATAAFIECQTVRSAEAALLFFNHKRITKVDTVYASRWEDFDISVPEEYVDSADEDALNGAAESGSLTNTFLLDEQARPQLIVKGGSGSSAYDVEMFWFDIKNYEPRLIRKPNAQDRDDPCRQWTEVERRMKKLLPGIPNLLPCWSPQGTYLVSLHSDGIKLWGGSGMHLLGHFIKEDIESYSFSPCEKYLLLSSSLQHHFYTVSTGKLIKSIQSPAKDWSQFSFSACDTYVGFLMRVSEKKEGDVWVNYSCVVYRASDMTRLCSAEGSKTTTFTVSFKGDIESTPSFAWSPIADDVFALCFEGDQTIGWSTQVMRVVEDRDNSVSFIPIVKRNMIQVDKVAMSWHPQGTFLGLKKLKNGVSQKFTILHISRTLGSSDEMNFDKEVRRFNWQPCGSKYAVLLKPAGKADSTAKTHFAVYSVEKPAHKQLISQPCEAQFLYWNSKGNRCVALNSLTSKLYFFSVEENAVTFLTENDHQQVGHLEWDPSGRFCCTWTSALDVQMDNKYIMFNVNGEKVFEKKMDTLSHIAFRPLPRPILTADELKQVKMNLPKWIEKHEASEMEARLKKEEAEKQKMRVVEAQYVATMQAIKNHHDAKDYLAAREKLHHSSPAAATERKLLKEMAEESQSPSE